MKIVALACLALACHHQAVPTGVPNEHAQRPSAASRDVVIARGEYVATIAGCTSCHGKDLAGGNGAPNITIDAATGIGTWSDWQIIAAIRRGVRPDGKRLVPEMPYPFYNHMTDEDALALVAWIRAQSATRKQVARRAYPSLEPIDVTAPTGNIDRVTDPLAHGAYLAALMHCGGCHVDQQPSQIVAIGEYAGHERYKEAWSRLEDDDAHALAMFVQTLQPHQR
jgi:mono/diheme cytochrome c family protein